jgi:hypothetical protein
VRDVIRRGVVVQNRADPMDSEGEEAEPGQAECRGMPAGDVGKQGEDQAAGEGSQEPRTGNFGGVPEDDTADEEKKQDGKRPLDHAFYLTIGCTVPSGNRSLPIGSGWF